MGLGSLFSLRGKNAGYSGPVSALPVELIQQLTPAVALPITVGGANRVTFTLNASVTRPAILWNGDEPIIIKSTVTYTWTSGVNNILSSAGAQTTNTGSTLGIWYMYIDQAGSVIWPSQTAPVYAQAEFNAGVLGHPGTSRAEFYHYIGIHTCTTAATPVFLATKKVGFTYHFAAFSVATTAAWISRDFTTRVPAINGIQVAGTLTTGTIGTVNVSGSSVDTQGVLTADATGLADLELVVPFGPIDSTGAGTGYAEDTITRGAVAITQLLLC